MIYRITLAIIASLSLAACVDESKFSALEKSVAQMDQKISQLESDKERLEKALTDLSVKFFLSSEMQDFAYLTPGSDGYSVVRFDLGMLTVGLDDIQPYANGSKVKFKFGNPLGAVINGLNMEVEWGQVDDKGQAINETMSHKALELNELLRSSSWTSSTVILENTPPNKLGFVRLRNLSHRGIRLTAN